MKKHPSYKVTVCHNSHVPELVAGRDFLLCPMGLEPGLLPETLPSRLDDFVRVAGGVHIADTVARRGRSHGGSGPSRLLDLSVEVSEPEFWNRPAVQSILGECLHLLGHDEWRFRFEHEPRAVPREVQNVLPFFDRTVVCLYSGGLDSAAGLAARLRQEPSETFIPVTVRHQSNLGVLAGKQVKLLKRHFCRDFWNLPHVTIGTLLRQSRLKSLGVTRVERSHRCRAFLFAAVGGVVASLTGSSVVEVYESGVGAVNLPLMAGMVGPMASHSCHPRFLSLMSTLLGEISQRSIQYVLPFRDHTKGEMVQVLAQEPLKELACSTVSCVHYPLRRKEEKQCGVCPGCIYRRLAMFRAGIVERPRTYAYDLFKEAAAVPMRHHASLKAFLQQVARLSLHDGLGTIPLRLRTHLIKSGIVHQGDETGLIFYAELFRRYCREWLDLAAMGQERGWSWAGMLGPRAAAV